MQQQQQVYPSAVSYDAQAQYMAPAPTLAVPAPAVVATSGDANLQADAYDFSSMCIWIFFMTHSVISIALSFICVY